MCVCAGKLRHPALRIESDRGVLLNKLCREHLSEERSA